MSTDPLPLDVGLYSLDPEQLAFFKSQTGIDDEGELKEHILGVQAKAYKIVPYPCIRRFAFIKSRMIRSPYYKRVVQLQTERSDALFLDAGCNLGHDLRKVVADGWPVENVIAFDLIPAFWDHGHELFRTTRETFPAAFVAGDVFDPSFIAPREPFYDTELHMPRPSLRSLTSLTPLQGFVSVIHASSFFHLFEEKKQLFVARQLATLLSAAPGSFIFGSHAGKPVKEYHDGERRVCLHSPESWRDLWVGQVFVEGGVSKLN